MSNDTKYDFETMVQVAKMYYRRNMNQQDIAKEFGWSRSMVSMILSKAKERGIIEIRGATRKRRSSPLKGKEPKQDAISLTPRLSA